MISYKQILHLRFYFNLADLVMGSKTIFKLNIPEGDLLTLVAHLGCFLVIFFVHNIHFYII